jgi:plasmid stability protein
MSMPTVTVKNMPPDLYERLKQSAWLNRRSINSEMFICIERAIRTRLIDPDAVLAAARRLREKTAAHSISDYELTEAKAAGRP